MKRLLIIFMITITLFLSGCQNDLSPLEERIREFDYYTEIFDFTSEGRKNIKLLVAYNESSTEVTYIYYMDEIISDFEILFVVEDEIVYEDFVVVSYVENERLIGEFTGSSLELDNNVTLAKIMLVSPGFITVDSKVGKSVIQEFNVVNSTEDIIEVDRLFVSTENYLDRDIRVDDVNIIWNNTRTSFYIISLTFIALYIFSLYTYKKKYGLILIHKLNNPESNKYSRFPDLQSFKYIVAIAYLLIAILSFITSIIIINNSYNSVELYDKYNVNYEEYTSDEVNLKIGRTRYNPVNEEATAFVNKEGSHNIMGDLEVTLTGEYNHKTIVPSSSYGGYHFKLSYRFLQCDKVQIAVSDYEYINGNYEYVLKFFRELNMTDH